jgi:hypothetical protein
VALVVSAEGNGIFAYFDEGVQQAAQVLGAPS